MTILKIIEYPDPFLKITAKPVNNIDEETIKLIKDMAETMFKAPGVGLAATQVRSDKRIIVYNPNSQSEGSSSGKESSEEQSINEKCDGEPEDHTPTENIKEKNSPQEYKAIINPEIIAASGSLISENEACLSVPDYSADVKRFSKVTVRGLNMEGKKIQFDAEDIQAVIMQHEIDHLDGILYIDRISMLKRNMYKKRVQKKLKKS